MAAKKKAANEEPVSREQILLKYWELANLDPEATKGTITGQLKALDSLLEERGRPKSPAETPNIYQPAWMRK